MTTTTDPGAIDIEAFKELLVKGSIEPRHIQSLIAAVEALRARVVEQDKLIARLEEVLKETGLRNSDLAARAEAAEARARTEP